VEIDRCRKKSRLWNIWNSLAKCDFSRREKIGIETHLDRPHGTLFGCLDRILDDLVRYSGRLKK
jgi:hypothetical protein